MSDDFETRRAAFIEASFWYGPLDTANAILAWHPEIASSDIQRYWSCSSRGALT